jgi:hypothetical protein
MPRLLTAVWLVYAWQTPALNYLNISTLLGLRETFSTACELGYVSNYPVFTSLAVYADNLIYGGAHRGIQSRTAQATVVWKQRTA